MIDAQLRIALERIAQAAEQYLNTEHRDEARDLELRRNLGEAATDAALLLTAICPEMLGTVLRCALPLHDSGEHKATTSTGSLVTWS